MTIFAGLEWVDKLLGVTIFAILVAVFMPLERLVPFHDQPVLRRNWYHDLSFWVINRPVEYAVAAGLIIAVLVAALLALGVSINTVITTVNDFLTP